jgi:hypothetical protein
MRIVAIRAGHMTFQHGMVMRETEFGFLFHVAGEAHLRILFGIDDLVTLATAAVHVQAPGTMAHFTTFYFDAFHRNGNAFVSGEFEGPDLLLMAHGAGLGTDIFGAFHLMVFQDFLEGFNIHVAAGGKKESTSEHYYGEDYFFTVHTQQLPG